jgi:hypothetical protein
MHSSTRAQYVLVKLSAPFPFCSSTKPKLKILEDNYFLLFLSTVRDLSLNGESVNGDCSLLDRTSSRRLRKVKTYGYQTKFLSITSKLHMKILI